jgi:hypothetical protein
MFLAGRRKQQRSFLLRVNLLVKCGGMMIVTFSLERKSNQKVQGKPDRSARFSLPARGKSQIITL